MICWKCHKEIPVERPGRGDECPLCHADLHVCKACDFYDSGAYNKCRESSAEFVGDKERRNYCDYFRAAKSIGGSASSADAARAAAAALFSGNAVKTLKPDDARSAFDSLFG